MPTPISAKHKSQADYRRSYTNVDAFGRPWAIIIEKETGDPVMIAPAGWDDPLRTPMKYLVVPTEVRGEVVILWAAWQRDAENAFHRHKRLRDRWGRAAFGTAYDPANPHADAVYAAGDPPLPAADIAKAEAGDEALLGLASVRAIADRAAATAPAPADDDTLAQQFAALEAKVARMEAERADLPAVSVTPDAPPAETEEAFETFLETDPGWAQFHAWLAKRGKSMDEIRNLWEDHKQSLAIAAGADT